MLVIMAGFAYPIFVYYQHRVLNPSIDTRDTSRHLRQRHRHEIQGFRYEGTQDGRSVISIKADRFSIQKKKIGFFRFGLLNEAKFENARIHIYGRRNRPENKLDTLQLSNTEKNPSAQKGEKLKSYPQGHTKRLENLIFDNVLSKGTLPLIQNKRVSSLIMAPVKVVIHDERNIVSRISAFSASIRLRKQDILFKGDVRMVSGLRVLNADQLSFHPDKSVVRALKHYKLKTPEIEREGQNLITDLFLTLK